MNRNTTPTDWPGRTYGVRAPVEHETPLSTAEVIVGLQDRTIRPHLSTEQRKAAIDALIGDDLLPITRLAVPAGAWRGHTPTNPGLWGGLLAAGARAANDNQARRHA
jgi:hypothetical protein